MCVPLVVTGILLNCEGSHRDSFEFFFSYISRGPMDTWMAWANEDPSKLS